MAIRPIRLLGDPILRSECEPITKPGSPAVRLVADDLQETLRDLQARNGFGGGLAAPQIGAPLRLIYVEVDEPLFLINPQVLDIGTDDFLVWDDCFSIPDLLVRVQRAHNIHIGFQDLKGQRQNIEAEGAMAALLQHEIDHLDGVLIVDRPAGLDAFSLRQEWNKQHARDGRFGDPFTRSAP
ncbi:MAG: peptide deformylase [Gemmatimonadota bacterium]|nr:MAG: peptide deformylase [Gemmatimonadota bacterium]